MNLINHYVGDPTSLFARRCRAIDDAALQIKDPEQFAAAVRGRRELDPNAPLMSENHAFFERVNGPMRPRFYANGGCPAYRGVLNAGDIGNVVCELTPVQLDDYVEVKFCACERHAECPIWCALGAKMEAAK